MQKKKTIVGIFAHPDDEAFGPGGTLAVLAKDSDVYIICATSGESADGKIDKKLGQERRKELEASCKILGVKKVFFLGFVDGTLSNNLYHEIAKKVEYILKTLKPDILLTFEPRGVSGHIDHIAISMITQFLFPKIKTAKKLMMYCVSLERSLLMKEKYFIHFPAGYTKEEIDEEVDITDIWQTKIEAMQQHKTQIEDIKRNISHWKKLPKKEYFLVEEK